MIRACLALALLQIAAAGAAADSAPTGQQNEGLEAMPRLVLVIVVDQLRRDRLDPALPGGLGRLLREGLRFTRARLAHAAAETCPGHAVLLTGRHPGAAGLPANYYVDRDSGTGRYCVEDDPASAGVIGAPLAIGRSPRNLRVDALGDWLKRAHAGARVFAVSAKDRAAVALGGQHPDGVFWLQRAGRVGFTTSRYYAAALPAWVRAWNGADPVHAGFLAAVPERWTHAPGLRVPFGRPDDYRYEQGDFSRHSSHPLRDEDPERFAEQLYRSPWVDEVTLDFARALVASEGLGADAVPDLLAVSLSGTDTIGHAYGPESHEAADALARLDAALGVFLDAMEARVGGRERLLVALSSDHGVLPIPEWLEETGRARCPVPGGRIALDTLRRRLGWHLHFEIGPWYAWPRRWLRHAGKQITVDRRLAAARGVAVEDVIAAAERWLEARPEVAEAWTAREIATGTSPLAALFGASYDPERSGDLALQVAPGCLLSTYRAGTSHGAPYDYDRDVPLVVRGPGIPAAAVHDAAATVDLAPTLAARLGIATPDDLDGRDLLAAP